MKRKTAQIIGGVVASACVITVIVVPCAILLPEDESTPPEDDKPTYTFDDYTSSKFSYKSLYPTWDKMGDVNKFITRTDDDGIVTRDVTKPDDNIDVLINNEGDGKTSAYVVSADKMFVYYRSNYKKVWRHSYTADFVIYQIGPDEKGTKKSILGFPSDGMIHHMEWSPTGHKLAFVHLWNIYVITNLEEANPTITKVTDDGMQNKIYNGIPDWVYEEEMISTNNVLYWSPESLSFAYLKTDDTNTHIVKFSMYNDAQYPETVEIAYPKAGTTNPSVQLFVYDITDNTHSELQPQAPWPTDGNFTNFYFSRLTWFDSNTCLPTWIDRPQTNSVGHRCIKNDTSGEWNCAWESGSTEYVDNGWVGSFGPFNAVWKDLNTHFTIYAREDDDDSDDGRWQIAKVDWTNGGKEWITKTNFDIVGLYFYDSQNDYLYFTAAAPLPRNRHVFRVKSGDTDRTDPECMTCDLDKFDYNTRCGWVSPSFNQDRSTVVVNCRGYWIPMTVYFDINESGEWSKEQVLYDNQDLETKVGAIKWPVKEYGEFQSDKYGKAYKYELFKPADFDETKKYPLLIEVYAGPEFQSVNDIWTRGWATTHMVSDKNIIVASVDGRGSAYEGYKFMREAYLKLGQNEPVDQTDFAAHLASRAYIDDTKVGIWGWSYGGYTTSHTLGYDGGNTFKCGIAVAPLADWRFYDSMYAERYMGLPENNDDGYAKASIVTGHDLANFKQAEYVLIHGTADDNVHFQNAAEMEKALVEADVDFDDFFYADEAHSINSGKNANKHIYRQLTTRMSHCLGVCQNEYPGSC